MVAHGFEIRFLYQTTPPPDLDTVVEVLARHDTIELRQEPSKIQDSQMKCVPYEYGSLYSSLTNREMGDSPDFANDERAPGIRIPFTRFDFLSSDYSVATEACDDLLNFTRYLYENLSRQPDLVTSTIPRSGEPATPIIKYTNDGNPDYPRRYITWFDIYSPTEIRCIGRGRLLSSPAPRTEVLADGSLLIMTQHPLADVTQTLTEQSAHLDIPISPAYPVTTATDMSNIMS